MNDALLSTVLIVLRSVAKFPTFELSHFRIGQFLLNSILRNELVRILAT